MLVNLNNARWAHAKLTADYRIPLAKVLAAKDRYKQIEVRTGVPWYLTACIHMRESNFNFSCSLAQGDPWDKPSTHVPKNRGPFKSFEEAADDAFLRCPPYLAKNTQWAFPASLTALEAYNGLGYYKRGLPSPYIWSGTDQYQKGKYVSDGRFDPNVVDKQLGAAGLILSLLKVDPALLGPITPSPVPAPVPQSPPIINTPEPDRNQENFFEELWHWLERHLHG